MVFVVLVAIRSYTNDVTDILVKQFVLGEPKINEVVSTYKTDDTLSFVKNTDSFIPYSYNDVLNIIFTTINNGWTNFTFYCPNEYKKCVNDTVQISKDSNTLTHINNFVHPYNSFSSIRISIADSGEVNVKANYLYDFELINEINKKVREIINSEINKNMNEYDKIKVIHDYIINNTEYDVIRNEQKESPYLSHLAYGPLFQGKAICSGYTDLMAIFLNELNIRNFKVSTTPEDEAELEIGHVWNVVFHKDKWLHLDLTWDDPVSEIGKNYLYHNYFLISTKELIKEDTTDDGLRKEHQFNKYVYYELKNKG